MFPGLEAIAKTLMGVLYQSAGQVPAAIATVLHWLVIPELSLKTWTSPAVRNAGPVAESVLLLENIGTAVLVGPDQLASLHRLLLDAAHILGMDPVPDLYVRQARASSQNYPCRMPVIFTCGHGTVCEANSLLWDVVPEVVSISQKAIGDFTQNPSPNAYTLAIAGRKPFIVVHSALLELLKPAEVQAVLAHELGHLKCDHGVWLTAANVIASGTVQVRVLSRHRRLTRAIVAPLHGAFVAALRSS